MVRKLALEKYNYHKTHRTIKEFFRRNLKKGEYLEDTKYTPAKLANKVNEESFKEWNIKKTKDIKKLYKEQMDILDTPGTEREVWDTTKNDFKKGSSNIGKIRRLKNKKMTQAQKIKNRHKYTKTNANGRKQTVKGLSYEVEDSTKRYLPYDFVMYK